LKIRQGRYSIGAVLPKESTIFYRECRKLNDLLWLLVTGSAPLLMTNFSKLFGTGVKTGSVTKCPPTAKGFNLMKLSR
jgi:hypothetical protein